MRDHKTSNAHKVEKYDTKPREHREIKDQLPGVVVVPGFIADKLTLDELKLFLSWNGLDFEEPIHFEDLVRPPLYGSQPEGRPPMVYRRERLKR